MSDKQLFARSSKDAATFPRNTVRSTTSPHQLGGFSRRLDEHDRRLFCPDGKASLDLWEYDDNAEEFEHTCLSSMLELKGRLEGEYLFVHDDPRCRFVFIQAPNSRECLRVSRHMLTCVFTHHQVMPNFLDFIFPFGRQQYAEDFHFSGFREDTRMLLSDGGLCIPELGRSGREIRLCYSLKSVEPYDKPSWPWSVRQTALYHTFDFITGKALWVIVKGSPLIRDRVRSATMHSSDHTAETQSPAQLNSFESTASSFASTLATHLILCDWCDEDWRWYLTFLEKRLQNLTRRSLALDIPKAPNFVEPSTFQNVVQPQASFRRTLSDATKRTFSTSWRLSTSGSSLEKTSFKPSFPQPSSPTTASSKPKLPPVLPPGMDGSNSQRSSDNDEIFSVKTLQQVQFIEDKTNEVLLILESNIKILNCLKKHYQTILESAACPAEFKSDCKTQIAYFERRVANIVGDLEIQLSSANTLLQLLENRKSLLSGLLNHHNIEASRDLATKSQHSAKKLEAMTEAMHLIAVKTKEETVSMRVITLVTLFFLPGTFISTVMSTDIVTWQTTQESGQVFQLGALKLYLAITIPIMAATFAAWWVVYWYVNRRQEAKVFGGRFSGWLP